MATAMHNNDQLESRQAQKAQQLISNLKNLENLLVEDATMID